MTETRHKINLVNANAGRKRIVPKPAPVKRAPTGKTARISKLMALAIRFEGLIRDGQVTDQSELARLAHVTQPRMTQIMNLLYLAPDLQNELMKLTPAAGRHQPVNEKSLRPIVAEIDWGKQREMWDRLGRK
jgi:hypothetical protein